MTPIERSSDAESDSERLARMKREHWQVLPMKTITFAAGGKWRCPDERCGEGTLGILVPHPDDHERTPNRCPTCLTTAASDG
jgi:hypothetical protein